MSTRVSTDVRCPTPLIIEVGPRHTAWVRGNGVVRLTDQLGIPRQWDQAEHCWTVPAQRVQDLVADLERRKRQVQVLEVSR